MKWFIGIQAATRSRPLLETTLDSLRKAGWSDFVIFAEPGLRRPRGAGITFQPATNQLGAYANWRRMVACAAKFEADRYLLCQDDVVVWSFLKEVLEKEISSSGFAVYAPFTTAADHKASKQAHGWFKTDRNYYVSGAWVYAMNRDMIKELDSLMPPAVPNNKHIDAQVGLLMSLAGHPLYLHYPSLVSHVGASLSSLGYDADSDTRDAKDFIGESVKVADNSTLLVPETDYAFLQMEENELG